MAILSKSKRRRFRFTLRLLFLGVTLCAVLLGIKMERVRRQQRAVEQIRGLGGSVVYDVGVPAPRLLQPLVSPKVLVVELEGTQAGIFRYRQNELGTPRILHNRKETNSIGLDVQRGAVQNPALVLEARGSVKRGKGPTRQGPGWGDEDLALGDGTGHPVLVSEDCCSGWHVRNPLRFINSLP